MALSLVETYGGRRRDHSAAEAEILWLLSEAGFEIYGRESPKAEVMLRGEASGEFAARTGELVSARVVILLEARERREDRILAVARRGHTAVDLSAELAASRAFQEAAAAITPDFLELLADRWNE